MSLRDLPNLGATIASRLEGVGIADRVTLEAVGPAEAYRRVSAAAGRRLPLCYYLYSLEGALQGTDWRALPDTDKLRLRQALDE